MTRPLPLLLAALALAAAAPVRAQDAPPDPRPQAPFLAELPAVASWRIDYHPFAAPPAGGGAARLKVTTLVVRNERCRRDTTTYTDQTQSESWIFGTLIVNRTRAGGSFSVGTAPAAGTGKGYPEFPDLGWVDASQFKKVEVHGGEPCFVYQWNDPAGPPLLPPGPPEKNPDAYNNAVAAIGAYQIAHPFVPVEPTTVWVSVASRRPVALEDKHVRAEFVYDLPVPDFSIPPEYQKLVPAVDSAEKRVRSQQMVSPPIRRTQ